MNKEKIVLHIDEESEIEENEDESSNGLADNSYAKDKLHLRHILLYYYRKKKKIIQTKRKICAAYGDSTISERTVRYWFKRFKDGNFDLGDHARSGRPTVFDAEKFKTLLFENPRYSIRELGGIFGASRTNIQQYLTKFNYVHRLNIWMPKISDKNMINERQKFCQNLLKRHKKEQFLNQLIIYSEKRIFFCEQSIPKRVSKLNVDHTNDTNNTNTNNNNNNNNSNIINNPTLNPLLTPMVGLNQQSATSTPINNNNNNINKDAPRRGKKPSASSIARANRTYKSGLLSIWWDAKGLLYWQLQQYELGEQLKIDDYCSQLYSLYYNLQQKRPELFYYQQQNLNNKIIFLYDNIQQFNTDVIAEKFQWEVIKNPLYSPDISPTDYYLIPSLRSSLLGQHYHKIEEFSNHMEKFFNDKNEKFWYDGIMDLPNRWQKIIKNNGFYIK